MKIYHIKWDSVELISGPVTSEFQPVIKEIEAEDVQFDDFYVRAVDDDTGEKYYIPYQRIYDIRQIGKTELNDDPFHP